MTSSVVGWPRAHNTRFCTCWLCGTMWNLVRVTCVLCSSTDGISFRAIEGKPDTVKAETCEKCRSYLKILYRVNDPALEPLADDVATLGLDMLLAAEGWKRGGQNPFLQGYSAGSMNETRPVGQLRLPSVDQDPAYSGGGGCGRAFWARGGRQCHSLGRRGGA